MSFSLGENLSPFPVSTSTRLPAASITRQRVVYSQRLSASHDTSFDHSVFGTTPCMAPPSRRKFPPLSMVSFASPIVSTARSYPSDERDQGVAVAVGAPDAGATGASGTGGAGGASTSGVATAGGAAVAGAGASGAAAAGASGAAAAGAVGAGADAVASTVFGLWLTIQSATRATSPKR